MKRTEIHLKQHERESLKAMCSSGIVSVQVLQRAQTLLALDQGILDQQIADVLQIGRTCIRRVRRCYIDNGLEAALYDRHQNERLTEYDVRQKITQSPAASEILEKLTPREREVLYWVVEGKQNREIAEQLGIVEGTVKTHVSSILNRLNRRNRVDLVNYASKILMPSP